MKLEFAAVFLFIFLMQTPSVAEDRILHDQDVSAPESVEACRQRLLKRPEKSYEFPLANDKIVTVRHIGACEVDTQITLYRTRDDDVKYQILLPKKGSIHRELIRLSRDNPDLSVLDACDLIEMRLIESGPGGDVPAGKLLSKFEKMKIFPAFDNIIHVHGYEYEIWVTSGINQIYYTFQDSGSPSHGSGSVDRLEGWSQDLLALLRVDCDSLGPILGHDALP